MKSIRPLEGISTVSKIILKTRRTYLSINLLICFLLLFLIEVCDIDKYNELYICFALYQIVLFGGLLFSELRYPGLNILSILFVGLLVGLAIPSYSYATTLLSGKKVYFEEYHDISDFVFRTSVAISLYFSLFLLFLSRFSKGRFYIIDIGNVARRMNLFAISIILYGMSLILRIIPFLELISGFLSGLAGYLPTLVLLLLAVYCGLNPIRDKYYVLFVTLIIAEVIFSMFWGFYKGAIIISLAMYFVYFFLFCRTTGINLFRPKTFGLAVLFLLFVLYIVYPFMTIRRIESGFTSMTLRTDLNKVDNIDILKRVLLFDYNTYDDNGTESAFTERLSSVAPSAFFYKDAYNHGFHNNLIFFSMKKVVPKFLYPDKPEGSSGNMATNYIRYHSFDPICDSASSIGQFGGAYFGGGWTAALLMCLFNSLILTILLNTCFNNLHNLFSWLVIFIVLFSMVMCFKESEDGGFRDDVFYVVYIIIIKLTSLIVRPKKQKVLVSNNYSAINSVKV